VKRTTEPRTRPRLTTGWTVWSGILFSLLVLFPGSVMGQDPGEQKVGIGGGFNAFEPMVPSVPGLTDSGAHGFGFLTRRITPRLGYRADIWLGSVRDFAGQNGLAFGSFGGLQLGWEMFGTVTYLNGGLTYNHTPLSSSEPFSHDLGTGFGFGFEVETDRRTLFVEASRRWLGNVFGGGQAGRSFMLINLGVML